MNKAESETDLVARIRAGDERAEAELVERYSHGIKIVIRQGVGTVATADDIYQETFRIALAKLRQGEVREPEKLYGFIRSVARNLVIDHFRQATRQAGAPRIEEIEHLPHPAPDQLEELWRKELADLIWHVLKRMPNERDIQVLFRFYLAEEDKEKICADMGLTSLHFNVVLQRARRRFKELYKQMLGGISAP